MRPNTMSSPNTAIAKIKSFVAMNSEKSDSHQDRNTSSAMAARVFHIHGRIERRSPSASAHRRRLVARAS